jgi:hypothetical protein
LAALLQRLREHVPHRRPEAQGTVADRDDGRLHPALLHVAQQRQPALGRLAESVLERDDLLRTVGRHADEDQRREPLVLEAHVEVHPVGPDVDVDVVAVGE